MTVMNWWRDAKEVQQNLLVRKHKISFHERPNSEVGAHTVHLYLQFLQKLLLKEKHSL